ncbi:hypothetical protein BO94DRAFT_464676, partial [Aspergillus sclerotioniger CBS 115572]
IDNRYFFITDLIKKRKIKIFYILKKKNPVNSFIKILGLKIFSVFKYLLNIKSYLVVGSLHA